MKRVEDEDEGGGGDHEQHGRGRASMLRIAMREEGDADGAVPIFCQLLYPFVLALDAGRHPSSPSIRGGREMDGLGVRYHRKAGTAQRPPRPRSILIVRREIANFIMLGLASRK